MTKTDTLRFEGWKRKFEAEHGGQMTGEALRIATAAFEAAQLSEAEIEELAREFGELVVPCIDSKWMREKAAAVLRGKLGGTR